MENNKSLYAISNEELSLLNEIYELDGEITPEIEEKLAINQKNRNQKAIAYREIIAYSEARVIMATEMKKRAEQVIKQENNKQDYLKENLLNYVKNFGEFEVGISKFGTRKSETLEVESGADIPNKYLTTKLTVTPDKVALKKALKDGEVISGVSIKTNLNLAIK